MASFKSLIEQDASYLSLWEPHDQQFVAQMEQVGPCPNANNLSAEVLEWDIKLRKVGTMREQKRKEVIQQVIRNIQGAD